MNFYCGLVLGFLTHWSPDVAQLSGMFLSSICSGVREWKAPLQTRVSRQNPGHTKLSRSSRMGHWDCSIYGENFSPSTMKCCLRQLGTKKAHFSPEFQSDSKGLEQPQKFSWWGRDAQRNVLPPPVPPAHCFFFASITKPLSSLLFSPYLSLDFLYLCIILHHRHNFSVIFHFP